MKKKAALSVLMLTFMLSVSIFVADYVLAQLKPQPYQPPPTVQTQPFPSQPQQTIPDPPKVTYFKINNGAATTLNQTVTLNNTTERASQYRASERPDFYRAQWRSLIPAPQFMLSSGDGEKKIYFQVRNSMGLVSAATVDTIKLVMGPIVTSFEVIKWDNAGEYAYISGGTIRYNYSKLRVNTRNRTKNSPTHLRISGNSDFSDAQWVSYRSEQYVDIARGIGEKTIYLQLKNTYGMSKVYSAAFNVPSRRDFVIYPGWIKIKFQGQGFNCTVTPKDVTSVCSMTTQYSSAGSGYESILLEIPRDRPVGSRCDYNLFSPKQLNTGWIFKKFKAYTSCSSPDSGCYVQPPKPGTRQIAFKVHLWANAGKQCLWSFREITIEGPGDAHREEAFN